MATETHAEIEFARDDLEGPGHPRFTHRAQTIQKRTANQRAACAERPSLQNILAAAYTAVHPHFDA